MPQPTRRRHLSFAARATAIAALSMLLASAVATPFATAAPATTATPATVQWREAAGIADMQVYQPRALFGLAETTPYVSVTTVSTTPRCQFVDTAYAKPRARVWVTEVLDYRQCGNLGDVRLLRKVSVGPFVASIYGCGSCSHPRPVLMTWFARATFVQLSWAGLSLDTAIDFARDMRSVAKPAVLRPTAPHGAAETTDASYVLAHNPGCAGQPHCPLEFQQTSDGNGGTLFAVDLRAVGSSACSAFGVTYFFDGTTFLDSTTTIAPVAGVWAGSRPAWVAGAGEFGVNFPVTAASSVPCSEYGDLGVDTFLYRFSGTTMKVVAGLKPKAPQILN